MISEGVGVVKPVSARMEIRIHLQRAALSIAWHNACFLTRHEMSSIQPGRGTVKYIESRRFGRLTIEEDSIILFPEGLIGFEPLRHFAIVGVEEYLPLLILASLDDTGACFPIISPFPIFPDYDPLSLDLDLDALQIEKRGDIQLYSLVTLVGRPHRMVADLRNPIVIDVRQTRGRHITLDKGKYLPETPVDLGSIMSRSII